MSFSIPVLLQSSDVVIEASATQKAVQALSLDPAGHRMVSGGIDGMLKYWEFSGMNGVEPKPFREFVPLEGHAINALSFNSTGNLVLCVSSDSKARVYDREGSNTRALEETIKGDPYIRTPENTKGHTHMLSCGQFHPTEANLFQTGSYDCTVRLWDLTSKRVGMDQNIPHTHCFKCVDSRGMCGGKGMYVSSSAYSGNGGHSVLAGCSDGSIQLFSDKIKAGKTSIIARSTHGGNEVSDVQFTHDDQQAVSRGMDGSVAVWEMRFLRKSEPLQIFSNFPTNRSYSNLALIDNNFFVGGTSSGEVVCLEQSQILLRKKIPCRELIRTIYHPFLKQFFFTTSDGNIFILYDPVRSHNGALLFANKAAPAKKFDELPSSRKIEEEVFSYEELLDSGKYREDKQGKIKPVIERKVFNRATVFAALEQRKQVREENSELADVQRSLLKSSVGSTDLLASAYRTSQPEQILDFSDSHGAVDELLRKRVYCPKCGLKICTCGYLAGKSNLPVEADNPSIFPSVSSKRFRTPE